MKKRHHNHIEKRLEAEAYMQFLSNQSQRGGQRGRGLRKRREGKSVWQIRSNCLHVFCAGVCAGMAGKYKDLTPAGKNGKMGSPLKVFKKMMIDVGDDADGDASLFSK